MSKLQGLANRIANDIMTMDLGRASSMECTRLQMMIDQGDGTETNLGGRNKKSVVDAILPHLKQWVKDTKEGM